MQKSKPGDKSKGRRISLMAFVAMWMGGQMAGWLLAVALFELMQDILGYNRWSSALSPTLIPGMVGAVVQVLLVERVLKQPMRGWLPISLVGWLASGLCYMVLPASRDMSVMMMMLFVPAALIQALWLWPRVRAAWLWGAAGIASALVFALPLKWAAEFSISEAMAYVVLALAGALQSTIMATTMILLQHQRREATKRSASQHAAARGASAAHALRADDAAEEEALWYEVVEEAPASLHVK